jgi:hypothetical protein
MPILWEILDFNAETPMNLQIEKPPRFVDSSIYQTESGEFCSPSSSPL